MNVMQKLTDLESNFEQSPLEPMVAEHDLLDWLAQEPPDPVAHVQAMNAATIDRLEAGG